MRASYRTDGLAHNIKSAHVPNALGKAYYRNELTDHELLSTPVYLWLFVRFRALSAKQDRARRLASSAVSGPASVRLCHFSVNGL